MANIDIEGILKEQPNGRVPKTKIVCTLGPASWSVSMVEKLLRAGMNVARFNFSHGTHDYHEETLDNLRQAMQNTQIMCAVMLDTKCIQGLPEGALRRIILTASGGAFRDWPVDKLKDVKVADALKHPNWNMGKKITVDSATLFNKGLEVIEAHYLYGVLSAAIRRLCNYDWSP